MFLLYRSFFSLNMFQIPCNCRPSTRPYHFRVSSPWYTSWFQVSTPGCASHKHWSLFSSGFAYGLTLFNFLFFKPFFCYHCYMWALHKALCSVIPCCLFLVNTLLFTWFDLLVFTLVLLSLIDLLLWSFAGHYEITFSYLKSDLQDICTLI